MMIWNIFCEIYSQTTFITRELRYNTIQLIFDIAVFPRACQAQKLDGTDAIVTQSIVGEELAQENIRGGQSDIRTYDLPDARHRTLPLSHHAPCSYLTMFLYIALCDFSFSFLFMKATAETQIEAHERNHHS